MSQWCEADNGIGSAVVAVLNRAVGKDWNNAANTLGVEIADISLATIVHEHASAGRRI